MELSKYVMNVKGCCGCFNLRTGTLILLWLGLIGSILYLLQNGGKMLYFSSQSNADPGVKFLLTLFFFYIVAHLVFLAIIPCALGLYGVYERRPSYLKPYIYVGVFELVGLMITCMFIFLTAVFAGSLLESIMREAMEKHGEKTDNIGAAIGFTAFVMILLIMIYGLVLWYFLSVVYRYYEQLSGETQPYHSSEYNAPPRYDAPMKA